MKHIFVDIYYDNNDFDKTINNEVSYIKRMNVKFSATWKVWKNWNGIDENKFEFYKKWSRTRYHLEENDRERVIVREIERMGRNDKVIDRKETKVRVWESVLLSNGNERGESNKTDVNRKAGGFLVAIAEKWLCIVLYMQQMEGNGRKCGQSVTNGEMWLIIWSLPTKFCTKVRCDCVWFK